MQKLSPENGCYALIPGLGRKVPSLSETMIRFPTTPQEGKTGGPGHSGPARRTL